MDILVTRKSSSLTCHKWLKDEPSKCNGRCSNKQSQVINVKGQTVRTFDMLDCEFKKDSPYVEIAARKIPMDNKIICSHHI
ncbi:unnamed protein product [Rotaria sordida]|uniref:Uncharacterized protein n=1 Tax=Rotaria sordida TaxID=392033 RepID=A0A814ISE9_9BILA|nr:unnamed protein product [Rotaria sordida]CAF1152371.1 unnamed protein product [Rotaria sordida]